MADYYLHKTADHIDELLEKVEGLDNYDDAEVRGLINNKVDKVTGKGLSTNDFMDAYKEALDGLDTSLGSKVDKETGKGLSTNDFTDAYKTELDGLDTALNGKVDKETGKGLSTNDYTTSEKTKLNGIESGANANVQVDWNQTDTTADDYIKNKPNIPSGVVVDQVYDSTSTNAQSGVAIGAKKPGEITTGKQYTIGGQTVTAGTGAEAFNDLEDNKASGVCSHAEGYLTTASGESSHAEGMRTTASGDYSHAEGYLTTASGESSHAEGMRTTASGDYSHAEGYLTKASSANQHVQGKFNVEDANNTYAFIIGNGTFDDARHNAFAIDWNGLIYVNGSTTGVDVSQLTPVTVDQTYSASSTNAQSGTAVASAIAGKISATDYATQNTGGTVKAWATTDGSDTILHLATQ